MVTKKPNLIEISLKFNFKICYGLHWKLFPLRAMEWSGTPTSENEAMNFLRYYATQIKLLT